MSSIFDFEPGGQHHERPQPAEAKRSRKKEIMVRWNLTQEALVDSRGAKVTNAILLKAGQFLDLDLIERIEHGKINSCGILELWICKPKTGYNKTTYTIRLEQYSDFVNIGCNCQWGSYNRLCSHALAVLIQRGLTAYKINVHGGVR